ncbi:MAG: PAS domain-containing sensor histidine kinase [Myxococcota bacterium]|nr:PAS domain-containing sensor histidine kinase [Myxococcota bacterium]
MHRHDAEIATYLFENARDILLVIDAEDGRIIDANEAADLAYGYPRPELLARTIFELRASDRAPVDAQMRAADSRGLLFEALHQRRDGSTFHVEVNSRGQTIAGRRMLLSVVRDITERKRLELEREALIETTRRALALRDEFLVVASHELRSPVTNVSLQLQKLQRSLVVEVAPRVAAAAASALAEVARLSTLIDTLLDAQLVGGTVDLSREPVQLAELVRDVASRVRARAQAAGSELTLDVAQVQGAWDRLRLEQAFTNLLINAVKYGRGRPIHVTGTVEEAAVHIEVRDQGIGIAPADAARIFGKFERAVPPAYGGLGLGLYITRQLIHAHGGEITLASQPGEGSAFRVTLPIG